MRAAVIGSGHLGQHHARIYTELDGIELAAVVDIDEARGREIATRYDSTWHADYQPLLPDIDLASIAVPTVAHYHHCAEGKTPPALDDLGNAFNVQHALVEIIAILRSRFASSSSSHDVLQIISASQERLLEFQSTLAGRFGQRLHPSVILVASPVEYHLTDACLFGTAGQSFPDKGRLLGLALACGLLRHFRLH